MKKEIGFVMNGMCASKKLGIQTSRYITIADLSVDLDVLSPGARAIAENIYTTENADDLSLIYVSGPTRKELMIKDNVPEKEIEAYERMWGDANEPVIEPWMFDKLRHYETPEEYFERQVSKMKEYGWLYISHTYMFSKHISINYKLQ